MIVQSSIMPVNNATQRKSCSSSYSFCDSSNNSNSLVKENNTQSLKNKNQAKSLKQKIDIAKTEVIEKIGKESRLQNINWQPKNICGLKTMYKTHRRFRKKPHQMNFDRVQGLNKIKSVLPQNGEPG